MFILLLIFCTATLTARTTADAPRENVDTMAGTGKYASVMTVVAANVCVVHIKHELLVGASIRFAFLEIGKESHATGSYWMVSCFYYKTICISLKSVLFFNDKLPKNLPK